MSEEPGPPAVRIRRAGMDDLEQVVAVNRDSAVVAYREIFGTAPFPLERVRARFHVLLSDPALSALIAERDGRAVGFVVAGPGGIEALYVTPTAWGRGIGSRLYAEVEPVLGRRATLWVLRDNARGRSFWEGVGWLPDGTSKIEHGHEEVRYHLVRRTAADP